MIRTLLKSKIHRATVTEANLEYMGSITLDYRLMSEADIIENERVLVVDVDNGNRFDTYAIPGPEGVVCVNGAAARLVAEGDKVIVMTFAGMTSQETKDFRPRVVLVDDKNRVIETTDAESHSTLYALLDA